MANEDLDTPEVATADEPETEAAEAAEQQEEQKQPLSLQVTVNKPSACERHVTVVVSREDINRYFEQEFNDLAPKAEVPGFRPGRAPRKLVVNRFKEQVGGQVKGKLLVDAMGQVGEEHNFSAISEPDFDLEAVKLPDEGPMTFEFKIEVRPEFDLPDWKGLTVAKPVRELVEADVDQHLQKLLSKFAKLAEHNGPAEAGDFVTLNITCSRDGQILSTLPERSLPVKPKLSFRDAELVDFGRVMTGARAGDRREAVVKVSAEVENESLRGQEIKVEFEVLKVEKVQLPKLTQAFLEQIGGFADVEDLRSAVREELTRQQKYRQQQYVRQQITQQLTASANWELPPTLLKRQAGRELKRVVLELQSSGFSDEVIQAHANDLQRRSTAYTSVALKEHFILERIAEEEKIDAEPEDFNREIELIAEQSGVPPRRVRARLEKRGEMDSLRNQIIERKVIELITSYALVKEVPFEPSVDDVAALDHAVCGEAEREEIPVAKHGEEAKPLPGQPTPG
jgi:trigger factor